MDYNRVFLQRASISACRMESSPAGKVRPSESSEKSPPNGKQGAEQETGEEKARVKHASMCSWFLASHGWGVSTHRLLQKPRLRQAFRCSGAGTELSRVKCLVWQAGCKQSRGLEVGGGGTAYRLLHDGVKNVAIASPIRRAAVGRDGTSDEDVEVESVFFLNKVVQHCKQNLHREQPHMTLVG